MTQTSTPKFVEVVVEVMQVDKVVELFKTIAIVSLDMGYLTFGGEQFEEQVGYRGEGEGNVIKKIR